MLSCSFNFKVCDNGQISPCRFLVCYFGDAVLFRDLTFLGALSVSDDVLSPDCVLSRGSSVDWLSSLVAALPDRRVFGLM